MIDSSFLLRNFVYQKIIRVINSFIVHLNAACASLEDIIKPTPLRSKGTFGTDVIMT